MKSDNTNNNKNDNTKNNNVEVKASRCAIYCRGGHENEIRRQKETCDRYLKALSQGSTMNAAEPYVDSGGGGRPAFQSLLEAINSGLVDLVVVEDLTRLPRRSGEWAAICRALQEHRVRLVSVAAGLELAPGEVGGMLAMIWMVRESESRVRHRRPPRRRRGG